MSASTSGPSLPSSSNGPSASQRASASSITLADLTACVRRTTGDRPPPLVGCSVTLVGDDVYLFGGRLVPTRTMVSTLYVLSLRTLEWTRHWPPTSASSSLPSPDPFPGGPSGRYFHSAEAWGNKIVIFGGEGYSPVPQDSSLPVDQVPLCTLNDVVVWDTVAQAWEFPQIVCEPGVDKPESRYAHLGVVTSFVEEEKSGSFKEKGALPTECSLMIIMGGQDIKNTYLTDVNVLDLNAMKWVRLGKWDRHIGTYRAVATTSKWSVVPGGPTTSHAPNPSRHPSSRSTTPSPPGDDVERGEEELGNGMGLQEGESLCQLSYSERPRRGTAQPILLFSNFNFTHVRRDLDVLSAPVPPEHPLDTTSLSSLMSGLQLPPGLRFPTGTIVGRHLLLFGTFLSHSINTFAIWALDLGPAGGVGVLDMMRRNETLNWTRVDPGSVLSKGSWNRAVGWKNSVVVLGDRERDIAKDYDHRQTNFAHIAFVDLEAFGIYQPPPQPLPPLAQSFGLLTLSQPFLADFEIICSDGKRLGCSRKILDDRWPWFRERMDDFKGRAKGILAAQKKRFDAQTADVTDAVEILTSSLACAEDTTTTTLTGSSRSPTKSSSELRLTPRTLNLPEPARVVQGFLQYLYTLTLCTPLQLSLPVLSSLLVFSKTYEEANLRALVVHALHEALNSGTWTAAAIYEAATLGGCTALQIRSLRAMMGGTRGGGRKNSADPTERMAQSPGQPAGERNRPHPPTFSLPQGPLEGRPMRFSSYGAKPVEVTIHSSSPPSRSRSRTPPRRSAPLPSDCISTPPRQSSLPLPPSEPSTKPQGRRVSDSPLVPPKSLRRRAALIELTSHESFVPTAPVDAAVSPTPVDVAVSPTPAPLPLRASSTPSSPPPRRRNDEVAVPIPDAVPPKPVPRWSVYPPTPTTPPPTPSRHGFRAGSFDSPRSLGSFPSSVAHRSDSDTESDEFDFENDLGTPKSTSTGASSIRSLRSKSPRRDGISTIQASLSRLEPQIEVEEPPSRTPSEAATSPITCLQAGTFVTEEDGKSRLPYLSSDASSTRWSNPQFLPISVDSIRHVPILSKSSAAPSVKSIKASSATEWRPADISNSNLARRSEAPATRTVDATLVSPVAIAELDFGATVFPGAHASIRKPFQSAPPEQTTFNIPLRPAHRPRSLETDGPSLPRHSFDVPVNHDPREGWRDRVAGKPLPTPPLPAAAAIPGKRTSSESSHHEEISSAYYEARPASKTAYDLGATALSRSVSSSGYSVGSAHSSGESIGHTHLPVATTPFHIQLTAGREHDAKSLAFQAAYEKYSARTSFSPLRARRLAAEERKVRAEVERALGAQALQAAGATDREIEMRARTVGYGILKEREKEQKKALQLDQQRQREEKNRMAKLIGNSRAATPPLLSSRFSLDTIR